MGRVGHSSLCTSDAFYDRSLLDWRKTQNTKASLGRSGSDGEVRTWAYRICEVVSESRRS